MTFNRKLWTIFMSAVTQPDSPLPPELRQNIANLGMFIMNQTRKSCSTSIHSHSSSMCWSGSIARSPPACAAAER